MFDEESISVPPEFQEWIFYSDGSIGSAPCANFGLVMSIRSCDSGEALVLLTRNESDPKQEWRFRDTRVIESEGCPGKIIEIFGADENNDAVVQVYQINGGWNQLVSYRLLAKRMSVCHS
jgi:hypothetical protein